MLGVERRDIYILKKCIYNPEKKVVVLLLITDGEKKHYTAVSSLSRMLASSNIKYKCKQHFCPNCLQGFNLKEIRDKHLEYCKDNEVVRIEMPPENSIIGFHDGQYQFKIPFVMFADFESILKPTEDCSPDPEGPYIKDISHMDFAFIANPANGDVKNPLMLYRGKDCVRKFVNKLKKKSRGFTKCSLKNL